VQYVLLRVALAWLQVVIRNGAPIAAIPPDYKLLDYDPKTHEYLYCSLGLSNDAFRDNQRGMNSVRAVQQASGAEAAEPESYPVVEHAAGIGLVRGLSKVLPNEGFSLPILRRSTGGGSQVSLSYRYLLSSVDSDRACW
jgi:hypothetical protein